MTKGWTAARLLEADAALEAALVAAVASLDLAAGTPLMGELCTSTALTDAHTSMSTVA